MKHFVLVFDRRKAVILEQREFASDQAEAAWAASDQLTRQHVGEPDVEVVLFGSRSEEDLRKTHGRYFAPLVVH